MRLDVFLVNNQYFKSRNKAAEAIGRGEVFVNGRRADKSSLTVQPEDKIEILFQNKPYVSLGGYKLEKALEDVKPDVAGLVFIDVGASTGGFTDCLLRNGAKRVYCVDVGKGLLDESLSSNERVVVMDETNARFLKREDFPEAADGIVIDCSFISLEHVLPPLRNLLKEDGYLLALIKPQFERGKRGRVKNGVIRDSGEIAEILGKIYKISLENSFVPFSLTAVTDDKKKNREFIIGLKTNGIAVDFDVLALKAGVLGRK